jgi:cupin fold WbuC family metalloprotein
MSTTFLSSGPIVEVQPEQLERLKTDAANASLRRARLCLHHSHQDAVQEMVIAFCRDTYNPPHRHFGKSESFHVIEGDVAVVFFDDSGNVMRRLELGAPGSGRPFLYRLSDSSWHTVVPLSEFVLLHETTTGPFAKDGTEIAKWAPDGTNRAAVRAFLRQLGY